MTSKDSFFIADELTRLTAKRYKFHTKYINGQFPISEYTDRMAEYLKDAEDLMLKEQAGKEKLKLE